MLDAEVPPAPGPRVAFRGSIAIELEWALASAQRDDWRADHPSLQSAYDARPDLVQRVAEMWSTPDTECSCYLELSVLAYLGDQLFTMDADVFLDDLERMCTLPYDDEALPLRSETEADRSALLRRLDHLRTDPEVRHRYVTLLRDLWEVLAPDWDRFGRAVVEESVAARTETVAKGGDWRAMLPSCSGDGLRDEIIGELGAEAEVAMVPAFFTHVSLLFSLPNVLIVGLRPEATAADARARTEALARRLKAISDPTRLAMVHTLMRAPRTVTELASAFALAQPTVSNHVKVLRDAGLVHDTKDGPRRKLAVQSEVAAELVAGLQKVLAADPQPATSLTHGLLHTGD